MASGQKHGRPTRRRDDEAEVKAVFLMGLSVGFLAGCLVSLLVFLLVYNLAAG